MIKILDYGMGNCGSFKNMLRYLGFQSEIVDADVKYPLSYQKLKRMHERVIADGFTSFAEA